MPFRFWKRVQLMPGLSLNLSKSGMSVSFGPRGAKFTVGPGGRRLTVGAPGTGLYYTTVFSDRPTRGRRSRTTRRTEPPVRPEDRLTLGFFRRLITPDDEEALVDGCRELVLGNEGKAFQHLQKATHLPDGAYLAGFLALKQERWAEAERYLQAAREQHDQLGRLLSKYGVAAIIDLPITDEVSAHVAPSLRGVLLGLVEVYQHQERWQEAIDCLNQLHELDPDDIVVRLSLAELLLDAFPDDSEACQRVVRLAEGVENTTPIHTALLYYKAKALYGLGLLEAARQTLTDALRRKKGRSEELRRAMRYLRAQIYEELGQRGRARREWERLYAEDPDYEDVAARLGL